MSRPGTRNNTRLFVILWLAGFGGILSLLLIDIESLLRILPLPAGTELPMSIPLLKLVGLIQPSVLVAIAVLAGGGLAPRVDLAAPMAEAAANGGEVIAALRPQIAPGILGGLIGGASILLIAGVIKSSLSAEMIARIGEFGSILPLPARLLYGGITEEVLLRWGFMTTLVWAGWRIFGRGTEQPGQPVFIAAILVSSIIFAVGHFPVAFMLFPEPTFALILFVLAGNSAFGLVGGYLFWAKGLESAMIAHAVAHLVMFAASHLGVYF